MIWRLKEGGHMVNGLATSGVGMTMFPLPARGTIIAVLHALTILFQTLLSTSPTLDSMASSSIATTIMV